ncbi:type II secretion system minor pseudopilin GspH [Legionella sp. CNM-4043-24]|uniref:type II secretion system minor pseudopilin GspH n=1 Tax=Legionella sp. CNM-4043-24 TaxID=3421646 RepID=UPI00403B0D48
MRINRGFTLIEVLVVIIIISIISTASILAFGDFGASRKSVVFAEQFASYVRLVRQRAILEMSTFGINVNAQGYETFRFDEGKTWEPRSKTSLFRWHPFPDNVVVSFKSSLKNNNKAPDIIIQASGDMTPFTMTFGTQARPAQTTLIGQHNGDVSLKESKS